MKIKLILIAAVMLMASNLWAAGSCVQTPYDYIGGGLVVKFACTGDSANGSIPTQTLDVETLAMIKGKYYLYTVKTYPTSGGTAPDAADVTVNMDGLDLLGAKGANLIHATATQDTLPYSTFMSAYRYPLITNAVTVAVANQGTANANFTFELIFAR